MSLLLLSAALLAPPCSEAGVGDAVLAVRVSRPFARPAGLFGAAGEEMLAEQSGVLLARPGGEPALLTTFRAAAFAPTAAESVGADRLPGDVRAVVRLPDGRSTPIAVLAADPHSGLAAFVPVEPGAFSDLPTARLAEGAGPELGETICILHRSENGSNAAVPRAVAGFGRSYPAAAAGGGRDWVGDDPGPGVLHAFGTLADLDPPPPPGASGGGAFDADGALVGLLIEPEAGDALPPRMLPLTGEFRRVVEALLAGEAVGYGLLGVEPASVTADAAAAVLPGEAAAGAASLEDVRGNSPAERAGLRRGDWIVGFTDESGVSTPVSSAADLVRLTALTPPGATVTLEAIVPRTGVRRSVAVALVAAATGRAAGGWPAVATEPRGLPVRGLRVDWPTAAALTPPGEPLPTGALIVAADALPVADANPLGRRVVRVGDRIEAVNGQPIASPAEFAARVAETPGPVAVRLSDGTAATLP
ncbi:trypsin-like peptidase domain-containing protein [Alienimonas californiensis]|uniref:Putative periplasmic serine endoprotease DegP-like n=1 Tax=Alienimonas californiensis TaxID=2527989 RepID=A0A517PEZ2_9PLAN|nr:trypsin-like peptidase domain-containing protein [Alienimonas californiensis]QDT17936.1 putative periplasmic serine endoprotease DegP-like precursor [Alienimonas californiensis]